MNTLVVSSCVRGYHIYQDRWIPVTKEELFCLREPGNIEDPHAVAILKDNIVVGHVPRKISTMCSMFLRKGGLMKCTITGSKRYSSDLTQGGMEVPCKLTFFGEEQNVRKLRGLLPSDSAVCTTIDLTDSEQKDADVPCDKAPKRMKLEDDHEETAGSTRDATWVEYENYSLSFDDLTILSSGRSLSDKHINLAQELIKKQHPNIMGLKSTLLLQQGSYCYTEAEQQNHFIQVIHINFEAHGNSGHWIVASNVGGEVAEVTVYDSLSNTANKYTKDLLKRLLKNTTIKIFVVRPQIQNGYNDCGLFALAFATSLANGEDLSNIKYDQSLMRKHLQVCFENKELNSFPRLVSP